MDFAQNQILVRRTKGGRDRLTMLPQAIQGDLAEHLTRVRDLHEADVRRGWG